MAIIRGSRPYLLEARFKLTDGISRLRVDVDQALRELGAMEAEKLAIDALLDELDANERHDAGGS